MPYPNKQAAVEALRPGYTITGEQPNMVTVPNPRAAEYNQPAQIQEQQGSVLTIQDAANPQAPPDTIIIKQVGNAPWKGGVGYDVTQGPTKAIPRDTTPLPVNQWTRLDGDGNTVEPGQPAEYLMDPKTGNTLKLDPTEKTGDPSQWVEKVVNGATVVWDPKTGKTIATVPARSDTAADRRTGVYDPLPDPNDPTGKRVIGMVDRGSKEVFDVKQQGNKQVVTTPNQIYVLNDDGSIANTIKIDKDKQVQAVILGDEAFSFDPTTGVFTPGPKGTKAATLSIDTTAQYLLWYDENGKEVARTANPNYRPPTATLPTPSLTAPNLLVPDPDKPGQYKWIPNEGRVTIGEATQNLIKDLTGYTADPNNPMTLDEAKTVIEQAISTMTNAANAAQNVMTTTQQGAATGAGILQQRAQRAGEFVQQGLGMVQGNRDITMPLPGIGAELTQGAAAYATELGGGQEVYDTAARLVKAADPQGSNPLMSAAAATLTQVMNKYRQATGQDHPLVQATKAAAASKNAGGLVAPGVPVVSPAAVNPTVFQAQFDPRLNPAMPQQPAGTVLPPGVAGTVAPNDPRRLRSPMAGFVAPETLLALARGPIQQMTG